MQLSEKYEKKKDPHKLGLIKLAHIYDSKVSEVCGMTYYMYCLFEDYECTLGEELVGRQRKRSDQRMLGGA